MDFAMVVASYNNAAVENVSTELPIRAKAVDQSIWLDKGLDYFGHTASFVLGVSPVAPDNERAWGLMAARLGNSKNRSAFAADFWFNHDWGLSDWLDIVGWPVSEQSERKRTGKLAKLDPPPRSPEALQNWQAARDAFRLALERCKRLRSDLEVLSSAGSRLRDVETQLPAADSRLLVAEQELASAARATATARSDHDLHSNEEAADRATLAALISVAPSKIAKLFRTTAWKAHEAGVRKHVARLGNAQDTTRLALARLRAATLEKERCSAEFRTALSARDALRQEITRLEQLTEDGQRQIGGGLPGRGFWAQPDKDLQRESPWNGDDFRAARDELFVAAVRLHRSFILAAVRTIKPSLNTVAKALQGGGGTRPSPTDWGIFFLVVPVVSTTFASVGRMFHDFGAGSIGWLMIDEAGQATPQSAMGSVWRARRAVVIGDPLQIEPVVTTPPRTTRLIFEDNDADPEAWAAPEQSAQTLADRTSEIQGRFRVVNGEAGRVERITGIPLLVHRRCERPMFDIANRIAYAEQMVFATPAGPSQIRDILGPSAWIDVDAPSADKWVEAEGRLIARAISKLCEALPMFPDLYIICPFKMPADRLRALLRDTPAVLPGLSASARRGWIKKRVGTVHTFQGKEAEVVILMLGAGRGAKAGSRSWAGRTPNLLNVAATRAKRALYIVGNRSEWQVAGVFSEAAIALEVRTQEEWLA
jgi:hypothetical protein